MTDYLIYDVFTDRPFGGNPLAVIPDARGLDQDALQTIAAEFNLSETIFLFPPADPAHTARARIFTPRSELPFAGHPTIGAAVALGALGRGADLVLELGVGPIPCRVEGATASFTSTVPLRVERSVEPALVAACASLPASAIRLDQHAPVLAGVGLPFALVELTDMQALRAATPSAAAFRDCEKVYSIKDDFFSVMYYVREGTMLRARMFAPLSGIPEDPATGSAAAALCCFLSESDGTSGVYTVLQGGEMGRPSTIEVAVTLDGGTVREFTVSGQAVRVMQGQLLV